MKLPSPQRSASREDRPVAPDGPALPRYLEPFQVGRLTRFFLWCGAVDRADLASRAETYRYANLGMLVCAVAALGATTFAIFTAVVIGRFSPAIVPAALGWGIIIFAIDRTIVAEPHYREHQAHKQWVLLNHQEPASGRQEPASMNGSGTVRGAGQVRPAVTTAEIEPPRIAAARVVRGCVYLTRVAITVCLAFLIAEAIMLLIFHPEVEQQLSALHASQFDQRVAIFTRGQQGTVSRLSTALSKDTAAALQQARIVMHDRALLAAEAYGHSGPGLTGLAGPGPVFSQDRANLAFDTARLTRLNREVATDRGTLMAEQTFLTDLRGQNPAALINPKARALVEQRKVIDADAGFDEQEKAFSAFLKSDQSDPVATIGPWALRVILICFDLLPLGAKLLNPYTIYGRRMTERALAVRYYDLARLKAQLRDVDHRAALSAILTRDDYDLSATDASWRRSWRMTSMGGPR